MKNFPSFFICTVPTIEGADTYVLHVGKKIILLAKVIEFNTFDERDEYLATSPPQIGAVSLKLPYLFEGTILAGDKPPERLASLMRRVADWHFAAYIAERRNK